MIQIGKKLQKRRRELKLTYENVSASTKLSVPHLKAIEKGDIEYFKDDLTYLRFYVRSYCKALDIPYENFKDDVLESVEEYTSTMTQKKQESHEKAEQAIQERAGKQREASANNNNNNNDSKGPRLARKDRTSILQNAQATSRFRKARHLDLPFLSLLLVIVIIVGILMYVGVNALLDKGDNESAKKEPGVGETTPTPEKDTKDEDEVKKKEPEAATLAFTQESPRAYSVSNLTAGEAVKIEITFKERCWFDGTLNNGSIPNALTNTTFEAGQTFTYDGVVAINDAYQFVFGFFPGTTIKVNGALVPLDATLTTASGVQNITLTLKGA